LGKIFEALDKTGLTEEIFQGIEKTGDTGIVPGSAEAPAAAATPQAPSDGNSGNPPLGGRFRVVSLRVSGASPVLPFESGNLASEQYRIMRTKIVQHLRQPRVMLVSSPSPGDGKSVTALNLAGALSLKGAASVILVDGDLRRPSIWRQLGVNESPGLADVLAGTAGLETAILKVQEFENLYVLPAGKSEHNPTELLDSEIFASTFARLKRVFKYVVVDSPPIGSVADYDLLTAVSDGVIVVVRPDHTDRQACNKALESIPKDKSLGVVMNRVSEWFLSKSYGYAPYQY
jgi:protein-tyrosine kinase